MSPLSREQKELLFDYCIGLTSREQTAEGETLIASNQEAADIHAKLKTPLALFDLLEPEACPDALADGTVWRLNSLARSSQDRLEQLLANEQARSVGAGNRIWMGLARILATAAVVLIAASVLFNALYYLRYNSGVQLCEAQMANVFQGLSHYVADYDGQPPAVAAAVGDPWWKVGQQGDENHSNTRNIYLLVRGGYVDPGVFVCPGSPCSRTARISPTEARTYKDFPSRNCVTYSFQVSCHQTRDGKLVCRKVVMADWNPLFEKLPTDYNQPFQLRVTKNLLTLNSINHKRHGQNVLFGDGRVKFIKTRLIGTDDIFTLQDTDVYHGCEVPSHEGDFFVAP
jgi:hypothetical protein